MIYIIAVVQKCTEYLWSDLNAKNVCRAFEFAKLFEEPALAERCLQVNEFMDSYQVLTPPVCSSPLPLHLYFDNLV